MDKSKIDFGNDLSRNIQLYSIFPNIVDDKYFTKGRSIERAGNNHAIRKFLLIIMKAIKGVDVE